ncbi:MAG: redoxin domain-containing protein [Planctomycetes bacterium]|nr:redoxin domain-containing protein [Planctomycetota bacterium]
MNRLQHFFENSRPPQPDSGNRRAHRTGMSQGHRLFLISLGLIMALYAGLILGRIGRPPSATIPDDAYPPGLLTTSAQRMTITPAADPRQEAEAYLVQEKKRQPVAAANDSSFVPIKSQAHPLVGKSAPTFELSDSDGTPHALRQFLKDGPLVLVFYYGYHCGHCVAQLQALDKDLKKFRDLGVNIVALSADPPSLTATRIKEFGAFGFPILSDADNRVATRYGVFRPQTPDTDAILFHGTFLIDQDGEVFWAHLGLEPFIDNQSLLTLLSAKQMSTRTGNSDSKDPP